jgi:hypothetical protein
MKKNSPHIAFGVGVAGVIVGNVLVARATLKVGPVLDDMKHAIDDVKTHREEDDPQRNKDLAYVYGYGIARITKLYGPAILVTGVSIASLTGSHVEMTRRNKALAATVVSITKAYEEYRSRVREEIGEDKERDIYYGVTEQTIVDENGKKQKVLEPSAAKGMPSPYARFYDEYSKYWQKDPEMNRLFVQVAQTHANQLLQVRGHVFLNEVYDALGIPRSQEGSVCGWVFDPDGEGDNYIDFGLYSTNDNGFVNGWNRSVLLDFNVDGIIYDKI